MTRQLPVVPDKILGALGMVAGITIPELAEALLEPALFVAVTVNV